MHTNETDNARGLVGSPSGQQGDVNAKATCCDTAQARRPTLREEAEKRATHHRMEESKAYHAASFFRDHPEFDEFIQLVRAGVIQI